MGFINILKSQTTNIDRYVIKDLNINNAYSNFGTSFYGPDKLIFAQPEKRNYIISNVWKTNNQPFLDLYVGDIAQNGELVNVQKFSSKINTRFHEADVCFSKDTKTVYFSRSNYYNGHYGKDSLGINRIKMFKATVEQNGEWSNIVPMPFDNDNYSVGHPALSEDEKTLYFISDMPGTLGKTDIFKVAIYSDGTYGTPVNLGPNVNTPEREMFPYVDGNDELYFSSDGRNGYGGLDIYMSKILSDGSVVEPINLGPSINSAQDDFAFIINKEKREGYFSSNRINGKGDDDIYYFHEEIPAVYVCNQTINLIVKNKRNGEVIPNATISITKDGNTKLDDVIVNNEGTYSFAADCKANYKFESAKKFYIPTSKLVSTSDKNEVLQNVVLEMLPDEFVVVRDKILIDIKTIYFDYDKFDIRPDAAHELDKVVAIMKKYPELKVEAGSHTDSRGPDKYNDILSEKRAESTVEYIISKGISADRIHGKGYGERQLVNNCSNGVKCTEEQHQLNRRTEFVIVNPEAIN